ncbi:hypothetical protein L3Q82_011205 [Scortum barcoo]|uniref:Uncharacterized protein n=1 Tax=Scortum barcoo TaxID=214431 RepID=A0ACB8W9H3_9TELE|nr:hypothetical protein L3Q82_011205 [Scortum barcoo]
MLSGSSLGGKTGVWEEFGEAMEEDYRSASKKFWQTVQAPQKGEAVLCQHCLQCGWGTVDLNWGHCWMVEGILRRISSIPPTGLPLRKRRQGNSEVDSSITQAEVTEVVRKLLWWQGAGLDEICPEYLKSLDVVGLCWLTRLCSTCMEGITLLSLPGKVYARVLERRIRPIVDPWIQEEQCGFRPGRGTLDQLYTLHRVLEGLWEFAQPVHMCFVDLEKGIQPCPSWYSVGLLQRVWGPGPFPKAVRLLLHVGPGQGCPLSPVLFIIFMDRISRRSQGPEGVRFGNHRISSLLFADDVVLLDFIKPGPSTCPGAVCGWDENEHLQIRGLSPFLKWRSSSISGSCSRVRERWSMRLTGGLVQPLQLCGVGVPYRTVMVKKGAKSKGEALDLPVTGQSLPRLTTSPMVMNFG